MSKLETTKAQKVSETGLRMVPLEELNIDSSGSAIHPAGFSTWVRALLQNWRQGTVAYKGRSDVARTNKKPWKQKGTGRARAGTARSPLWRGGGVIFGPEPRVRTLKVSKKVKSAALNGLLCDFVQGGKVTCLDWNLNGDVPKTKMAYQALESAGLQYKKTVLFLSIEDELSYASFVNIPNVNIVFFDQPNAYNLVNSSGWLVLNKDFDQFKDMVSKWI